MEIRPQVYNSWSVPQCSNLGQSKPTTLLVNMYHQYYIHRSMSHFNRPNQITNVVNASHVTSFDRTIFLIEVTHIQIKRMSPSLVSRVVLLSETHKYLTGIITGQSPWPINCSLPPHSKSNMIQYP